MSFLFLPEVRFNFASLAESYLSMYVVFAHLKVFSEYQTCAKIVFLKKNLTVETRLTSNLTIPCLCPKCWAYRHAATVPG